jgi:hypothetical protein
VGGGARCCGVLTVLTLHHLHQGLGQVQQDCMHRCHDSRLVCSNQILALLEFNGPSARHMHPDVKSTPVRPVRSSEARHSSAHAKTYIFDHLQIHLGPHHCLPARHKSSIHVNLEYLAPTSFDSHVRFLGRAVAIITYVVAEHAGSRVYFKLARKCIFDSSIQL